VRRQFPPDFASAIALRAPALIVLISASIFVMGVAARSSIAEPSPEATRPPIGRDAFLRRMLSGGFESRESAPLFTNRSRERRAESKSFTRLADPTAGAESWSRGDFIVCNLTELIFDPERDELIAFSGVDAAGDEKNETWVKPRSDSAPWSRLQTGDVQPPVMVDHASILDPVRHRMIVFGGSSDDSPSSLWALSLSGTPSWTQLEPEGQGPGLRHGARAIFDPGSDRMLLFGGYSVPGDTLANDVWSLSLTGPPVWTRLFPSGTLPTRRTEGAVVYDSSRRRMVVFGGWPQNPEGLSDVWALSLTDSLRWDEIHVGGDSIPALWGCAFAYDSTHDRLLILGGAHASPDHELWALQLGDSSTWSPIDVVGPRPTRRINARAVFDSERNQMVLFGGSSADTWELSLNGAPAWTEIEHGDDGGPSPRLDHAAAYDSRRNSVLEYGGWCALFASGSELFRRNDLWQLTFEPRIEWHSVVRDSAPPSLNRQSMIIDPVGDDLIMFGGSRDPFLPFDVPMENRVWQLSLSGAEPWHVIEAGDGPTARCAHSAVYDRIRRRMIVFGGRDAFTTYEDAWALSLDGVPRWEHLEVQGAGPGARSGHSAVYDPVGDRIVMFGGSDGIALHDDTWQLTLSGIPTWSPIITSTHPRPQAAGAMMAYDSRRQRLVLFGSDGLNEGAPGETWVLPLAPESDWMRATIAGVSPHTRSSGAAVYASDQDQFILLQGSIDPQARLSINADHDTWLMASSVVVPVALTLARSEVGPWRVLLQWAGSGAASLSPTVERRTETTAWLPIGSARLDGSGRLTYVDDTAAPRERYGYRLSWRVGAAAQTTAEVWVNVPQLRFSLAGATENPSVHGLSVRLSLIDAAPARLEVMDVAGRRLTTRDVGALGPGDHVIELAPPGSLPAGLYLMRLARAGESRVLRMCVIR
jgi:Galactose oxidase, central domain